MFGRVEPSLETAWAGALAVLEERASLGEESGLLTCPRAGKWSLSSSTLLNVGGMWGGEGALDELGVGALCHGFP
jgi:hypothetical protein